VSTVVASRAFGELPMQTLAGAFFTVIKGERCDLHKFDQGKQLPDTVLKRSSCQRPSPVGFKVKHSSTEEE
jgi:hypothetical protein